MIEFLIIGGIAGALISACGGTMVWIYKDERRRILESKGSAAAALESKLPQQPPAIAPSAPSPSAPAPFQQPASRLGADVPVSPLELQQELQQDTGSGSGDGSDLLARLLENSPQHYRICGPTRAGKTTLGEHLIRQIQGPRAAKKYLINPKHIEFNPSWSIPPFVRSIGMALTGLYHIESELEKRLNNAKFNPETEPLLFIIVDEWDWIFGQFKNDAVNTLRVLFKTGAELGVFVVLVGQSPLSKDTGLSQSDNRNFCQIILGSEAQKLLASGSFYGENREELRKEVAQLIERQERFCLVVPREGKAFVSRIPHLEKPKPAQQQQEAEEEKQPLTPEQAKAAFIFGLEAVTPQHEQGLPPHLQAILDYARKAGEPVSARQLQRANIKVLQGMGADAIREAFDELAHIRRLGEVEGEGSDRRFSAS